MPKTTLLNSRTALKIPLEVARRKWTLETGRWLEEDSPRPPFLDWPSLVDNLEKQNPFFAPAPSILSVPVLSSALLPRTEDFPGRHVVTLKKA